MQRALSALALSLLLFATTVALHYTVVRADEIEHSDSIPSSRLNWIDALTYPQFDTSSGILTSIVVSVSGDLSGTLAYTNTSSRPNNITGNVVGRIEANYPSGPQNIAQTFAMIDETLDGGEGNRIEFSGTLSGTTTIVDPLLFTPYIGLGTVTVPVTNSAVFATAGVANALINVVSTGNGRGQVRYIFEIPEVALQKLTNGNDADDPNDADVPRIAPGQEVTWTYLLTNTGSITIPGNLITVTDDIPGIIPQFVATSDDGDGLLAPLETWLYTASGFAADLLDATQTADYTIVDGCRQVIGGEPSQRATYENVGTAIVPGFTVTDPSHYCNPPVPGITLEKLTNGSQADDADDADVPVIDAGDPVTWTYLVTNTGNITFSLAQLTVTDSILGVNPLHDTTSDDGDALLAPGESWRWLANGFAADLRDPAAIGDLTIVTGCRGIGDAADGPRESYENVGTVRVADLSDTDSSHYCNPPAPGIELEKLTNGNQADGPDDPDVPRIVAGDPVTWTYIVTNIGNTRFSLAQISVTDSIAGVVPQFDPLSDNGDDLLEPGDSWHWIAVGSAAELTVPEETTNLTIVAGCSEDDVTQFGRRQVYENIGTVAVLGLTDSDPSHYCNPANPAIEIQKSTNGAQADGADDPDVPELLPGAPIVWLYEVTNTGNISFALNQVQVTDDIALVSPLFDGTSDDGDGLLAPGESWIWSATGVAVDLSDAAQIGGMTIVNGCSRGGTTSSDPRETYENVGSVTVPGAQDDDPSHYCNPAEIGIDIEKLTNDVDGDDPNDPDIPRIEAGDAVVWRYVVTNTGLSSFVEAEVVVTDDVASVNPVRDSDSDTGGDGVLSPGESWIYVATGIAADLDDPADVAELTIVSGCALNAQDLLGERETYVNVGVVVVPGAQDEDPSHYCNPGQADIDIEKFTNGVDGDDSNDPDIPRLTPGDLVEWLYVVTNTGNLTFFETDIIVTDNIAGVTPVRLPASDNGTDGLLSPGESWTYRAEGLVADLDDPAQIAGLNLVSGCALSGDVSGQRVTYANIGTVTAVGAQDQDASHYCNPPTPTALELDPTAEPAEALTERPLRVFLPFVVEQ